MPNISVVYLHDLCDGHRQGFMTKMRQNISVEKERRGENLSLQTAEHLREEVGGREYGEHGKEREPMREGREDSGQSEL